MFSTLLAWFLLAPTSAFAGYGGGGLTLSTANHGNIDSVHTGVLPCIGGIGYGVEEHHRIGGEGQICASGVGTDMFGGVQYGRQHNLAIAYWGYNIGLGGGYVGVSDPDSRFHAVYGYARPAITLGVPLGFGAVEGSAYVMAQLPLVQSLGGDARAKATFPTAGIQVSLLFGNFWDRRDRRKKPETTYVAPAPEPVATASAPVAPLPGSVPVTSEPAPEPPPGAHGFEDRDDSRPLAIPAQR